MKKFYFFLIITFLFLCPLRVSALDTSRSSVVMDIDSGRILYSKNMNEKRLIASITKIMTATIALEDGNLDREVVVGEEVLKMYGSNIYVEVGEKLTLKDLLYGLLLRSGNDSAVVIANNVSKNEEEFVKLMNKKAKEIGMTHTVFNNCHGLDEETKNYSTAHDMALLSSYIYKNSKEYREITKTYKYTFKSSNKSYLWYNRNKLLKLYKYATGGKTGYTPSAGRTLVTTATKNNLNLTAVTLKDANEYDTHEALYESAFSKYKNYTIVDKSNFKIDKSYFKDEVYLKESFKYPLTEAELDKVGTVVKIEKIKNYKNKDKIGYVEVSLGDDVIKKIDIFVKVKKKKKGFFSFLG
ncbi:MAG: D-alanyl-D-alanine carboxypeptidase [Bacilli bacterium]|nr:D-alanyl-D-alanine carboxypeptidase [Bacilli bacterium]